MTLASLRNGHSSGVVKAAVAAEVEVEVEVEAGMRAQRSTTSILVMRS
jgi:hypothetical protein